MLNFEKDFAFRMAKRGEICLWQMKSVYDG